MMKNGPRVWSVVLPVFLLVTGCASKSLEDSGTHQSSESTGTLASSATGAPSQLQPILEKVKIEHKLNSPLPLELKFRDEEGNIVALGDYFHGQPVILVLAYFRCPMLCNQVLNGVTEGLQGISFDAGKEFQVIVVSFDAREQPALAAAKKANYIEHYGRPGTDNGWHFLTGEQPAIDRLTQAVGFPYIYDSARDQFAHDSGIMIVSPEGRVSNYLYGVAYPSRDLRLALVEASARRIASPIDHVMLLCFHYDPATGRYSASVLAVVRLAGAITVLFLGTFLFRTWRRERIMTERGALAP